MVVYFTTEQDRNEIWLAFQLRKTENSGSLEGWIHKMRDPVCVREMVSRPIAKSGLCVGAGLQTGSL